MTRPNITAAIQAQFLPRGVIAHDAVAAVREAWEADRRALEGVTAPPTPEEIAAHHAAEGGRWLVTCAPTLRTPAPVEVLTMIPGEQWMPGIIVRWRRIARDGSLL